MEISNFTIRHWTNHEIYINSKTAQNQPDCYLCKKKYDNLNWSYKIFEPVAQNFVFLQKFITI